MGCQVIIQSVTCHPSGDWNPRRGVLNPRHAMTYSYHGQMVLDKKTQKKNWQKKILSNRQFQRENLLFDQELFSQQQKIVTLLLPAHQIISVPLLFCTPQQLAQARTRLTTGILGETFVATTTTTTTATTKFRLPDLPALFPTDFRVINHYGEVEFREERCSIFRSFGMMVNSLGHQAFQSFLTLWYASLWKPSSISLTNKNIQRNISPKLSTHEKEYPFRALKRIWKEWITKMACLTL